ncbi:TPA: hypothetical protein U0577_000999 [Streptococcus suis]|uniref:DUF5962 family protein n=2 Tax=Streptococcus suis TaxID=1307 RepID=A0AAW9DGF9_STRSU|nr:DUF5962 family protein [Streptococcus suis]MDX5038018.1 DUF5962 family protein [Streptococcus suis]HEL1991106.1 hypothetical protein [Streptococcus suis]HEM2722457.1 hypothetical protein [Streptococcus suis]
MDNIKYELEEILSAGFSDLYEHQAYQELKAQYEEETGDTQFSVLELQGRLDYILNQQDYDWSFPELPEDIFAEYMEKVGRIYLLNKKQGLYYLGFLDVME